MRDKQIFLKFCEHLRGLLKAGLPLRDALEILAKPAAATSKKLAERVLSFMKSRCVHVVSAVVLLQRKSDLDMTARDVRKPWLIEARFN